MSSPFVHLNVHTNYSLLSGADSVEDLLGVAQALGFDALAITDTNGLYGAIPFYTAAREMGIKPIIGVEIECGDEGSPQRAVCLAADREGYSNLCRIVTARQLEETFSLAETLSRHCEGIFILSTDKNLLRALIGRVPEDRLFHEIQHSLLPGFETVGGIQPVATNNVRFISKDGIETHRVLTAIRKNKLLACVGRDEIAPPDARLKSADEMVRLFSRSPVGREAIANTRRIADACNLDLDLGKPIFPKFFSLPDIPPELAGETPVSALRKLAFSGARKRYAKLSPEVMSRLEYELGVIEKLNFCEYFLVVWDIAHFARRQGIPAVGRGSAANSLVAYCLGITSADPIAHNLYFERFLNLSRRDCPDIDIDLCWRRRDEVLDYVYRRHGADRVAMVSNHNTYQARSAFRDVARVFGLAIAEINRLSSMLPHYSAESIEEAVKIFPEARDFPLDREPYRSIVAIAEAIDGFPRHLGVHIGGIVIGDRPLTDYLPLQRATKGLVISQYEMNAVEKIGLVKIDLLGHRSLTVITDTANEVRKEKERGIELRNIPDGDRQTARLLRAGRTIGCFQLESPGMRSLLQMIRAENRLDVIHALSLIRPGPSGSGMKERFIRRRLGEEGASAVDPRLEEVLRDTHGVMLFQEDILKAASVVAGFSLEEGDALRQAISKKRSPERVEALRERFMSGAIKKGAGQGAAEEIWKMIQNFASYSYCKAHAVTYGYISYQAAYLKAHYPAEFLCAVMANEGGFYETREYLEEARRLGVAILSPDINFSSPNHRCERIPQNPRGAIRIGLGQVRGLSQRALNSILRARERRKFTSLEDFYFRTQVNDSESESLILCGALASLGKSRPQLLWEHRLLSKDIQKSFCEIGGELFDGERGISESKQGATSLPEYSIEERIKLEQDFLGLAVTDHPLRMFARELSERKLARSDQLMENVGRDVVVAGWLVTMRRAVTKRREYMEFLTLEDLVGTMEVILFPKAYRRFGHLIRSYGPYLVRGRVEQNHRSIGITADWLDAIN